MKIVKSIKKALSAIWKGVVFALGFDGELRQEVIDEGLLDLSGQGRDTYGH